MQKNFIFILCSLFFMGCFSLRQASSKSSLNYANAIMQRYPTMYMSCYNGFTTPEFAKYIGVAKQTDKGIMLECKDTLTNKTHYIASYEDKTLKKPIGDCFIYDNMQRVISETHYDNDGNYKTTKFDSLHRIFLVENYEDKTGLKTKKEYTNTGDLKVLTEYIALDKKRQRIETSFRADQTKIDVKNYLNDTLVSRKCFDAKNTTIDCEPETSSTRIQPSYPGGINALMRFLAAKIKYPEPARLQNIQGKVYLQFMVDEKGKIRDIVPIRYPDILLMKEAVRVVKTMTNWIPGEEDGKPVSVVYVLPVSFVLE